MSESFHAEAPTPPSRLRWLEAGLWLLGIACLLWAAYGWGEAAWYQHRAEKELLQLERQAFAAGPREEPIPRDALPSEDDVPTALTEERESSAEPPRPEPAGDGGSTETRRRARAAVAAPLGRIVVPSVGVRAVIAEGVDSTTLRRAVGWLPSSAEPGSADGNVALAGHRDSFFRPLEGIQLGDEIRVETPDGTSAYRVEWIRIVEPTRMEVVAPTDYPALTLVTCYPFSWVGQAPDRFIVRARRVDGPVAGSW